MTRISKDTKEELNHFFEVVEKVKIPSILSSGLPSKKLIFEMGLIIFESKSSLKAEDVFKILPEGKARFFKLKDRYDWEDFLKELVIANREGQWLFVNCQADPAPTVIGILKQISGDNVFTVLHFEDKELFRMELNSKTRLIFAIQSDFLEREITYPFFMNLFGPIIRI